MTYDISVINNGFLEANERHPNQVLKTKTRKLGTNAWKEQTFIVLGGCRDQKYVL